MSIIKLPLCYQCGVPHVPEEIAARVRSGEDITIDIIPHKGLAANVLRWNCGGLNIDKSRVGSEQLTYNSRMGKYSAQRNYDQGARPYTNGLPSQEEPLKSVQGRFPSNVLFSHSLFCTDTVCDACCPVLVLEQQSGVRPVSGSARNGRPAMGTTYDHSKQVYGAGLGARQGTLHNDTGTAARFYHCFTPDVPFLYCAKSSRSERSKGCEGIEPTQMMRISSGPDKTLRRCTEHNASLPSGSNYYSCGCAKQYGDNPVEGGEEGRIHAIQNTHPTVKPQNLLRYLISMITPDHGIVLDMFFGSGSTGVAAIAEGYHFIGIEQSDTPDEPYCTIARARIAHALRGVT